MSVGRCSIVLALVVAGLTPATAGAENWRFSIGSSVNYFTGDYGTGRDTDLLYIPLTLKVAPMPRLKLGVTAPYIRQTSEDVVLTGGGVAARRNVLASSRSTNRTEHGLGDVLLRGEYVLFEESAMLPEVTPFLKIKFPTADQDKGLGTGEFDETVGASFSKAVGQFVGYVDLAYTFVGSPSGADFDNSFGWSLGASYQISGPVSVFAFLDGATAIASGQDNPLELRAGAEFRLTTATRLSGAVTKGLSDGSPDFGVSLGVTVRF
jgi:hypothetical protein